MKYTMRETKVVEKEIELKPCPFCGGENLKPIEIEGHWGYSSSEYYVKCELCGARGSTLGDRGNLEKAMEAWNRRKAI